MPSFVMSMRCLIATLCLTLMSACQPGGVVEAEMESEIDPLIGVSVPQRPATEALAAMCWGDPADSQTMVEAVNAARGAQGKTILKNNVQLTEIAQRHACDIAATGQPSVAGSRGSNVVDRARAVGYPTCSVAQLVAIGGTAEGTVASWLVSLPHRAELLGQTSDEIGVGITRDASGRAWWSVVLGEDC